MTDPTDTPASEPEVVAERSHMTYGGKMWVRESWHRAESDARVAEAVREERERCAKVVEGYIDPGGLDGPSPPPYSTSGQ